MGLRFGLVRPGKGVLSAVSAERPSKIPAVSLSACASAPAPRAAGARLLLRARSLQIRSGKCRSYRTWFKRRAAQRFHCDDRASADADPSVIGGSDWRPPRKTARTAQSAAKRGRSIATSAASALDFPRSGSPVSAHRDRATRGRNPAERQDASNPESGSTVPHAFFATTGSRSYGAKHVASDSGRSRLRRVHP
jgi:hypothetical protein